MNYHAAGCGASIYLVSIRNVAGCGGLDPKVIKMEEQRMSWKKDYENKITTASAALKLVKSGDYVALTFGTEPRTLALALIERAREVGGIKLYIPAPGRHFAWYESSFKDLFDIEFAHVLPVARKMIIEKRADFVVGSLDVTHRADVKKPPDVLLAQVSPPDNHGYCSFGPMLWNNKRSVMEAKIAIAEVNRNLIRTFGENFIHYSEFDCFVEHESSGKKPGLTDMSGRDVSGPTDVEMRICEHVSSLVSDGDCLEIGVGGVAEWLLRLPTFHDKNDLGVHSENLVPGIVDLVRRGIINGKRKTIQKGKVVSTACGGSGKDDMDFINMNPVFELYNSEYVLDPGIISNNDNVVAINSAMSVDLSGQIASESIGSRMVSSTGGQLAFAIGANMSKGGRNITVLPSTARSGEISRIVPELAPGTIVTVPRTLADRVVTEYGIASLKGKTQRERAEALINIADPDFREKLKKAAKRLFWP